MVGVSIGADLHSFVKCNGCSLSKTFFIYVKKPRDKSPAIYNPLQRLRSPARPLR